MPATIQQGSRGDDVRKWQAIIGVTADGVFGSQTRLATMSWQTVHGLVGDGVVGPATWGKALGAAPASSATTIARVPGIEKLSGSDLRALVSAAKHIGVNPSYLATAISFETGHTFSPSIRNKAGSGAVGLIQFLPSTAARLGTTADALANMSFSAQLEYVVKYFGTGRTDLRTLADVYLQIFSPKGIGQGSDFVMYRQGETAYEQNASFDRSGKGYITVGDVTGAITGLYNQAIALSPIIVPAFGMGAILLAFGAAYAAYRLMKGA